MKPEQITAWALEEASAEERQQLEAALRENPKAKQTAKETKEFCDFLLTELRDDSLALTDAQRERLKAQPVGQSSRLPEAGVTPAPRSNWRTGMVRFALAACVVIGVVWTWNQVESQRTESVFAAADEVNYQILSRQGVDVDKARKLAEEPAGAVAPSQATAFGFGDATSESAQERSDFGRLLGKGRDKEAGAEDGKNHIENNEKAVQSLTERQMQYRTLVNETQQLQKSATDPNTPPEERKERALVLNEKVKAIRSLELEMQERAEAVPASRPVEAKLMMKLVDPQSGLVADMELAAAPTLPASQPETPRMLTSNSGQTTITAGAVLELKKVQDQAAYGLNYKTTQNSAAPVAGNLIGGMIISGNSVAAGDGTSQSMPTGQPSSSTLSLTGGGRAYTGATIVNGGDSTITAGTTVTVGNDVAGAPGSVGGWALTGNGTLPQAPKPMDGAALGVAQRSATTAGDVVALQLMQEQAAQKLGFDVNAATERGEALTRSADGMTLANGGASGNKPAVGATLDMNGAASMTKAGEGTLTFSGVIAPSTSQPHQATLTTSSASGTVLAERGVQGPLVLPQAATAGSVAVMEPVRDEVRYFFGTKDMPMDAAPTETSASSPFAMTPPPVMLGIAQQNGVDLMTAGEVTTKAGTSTTMTVTREFLYPAETTVNTLTINGGALLSPAGQAPAMPNASFLQPGLIAGAGTTGRTFIGAGTLTFAGANTSTEGKLAADNTRPENLKADALQTSTTTPALGKEFDAPQLPANAPKPTAATLDLNGFSSALVTTSPAPPPVVMSPQPDAYYFAITDVAGREQEALVSGWAVQKDEKTVFRRQSGAEGESYTRILENELKDVAREPLSTFSIDVDTAAYANVRRFLNQNMIPPPDAVRIEELVNYFPTAEEGPAHDAKEPFAVRVEMAPCPWQPSHRLARIALKGRELGNERKNSNLVFLVDVSGSMNEPSKLPLVQQSLRMLTEQLGEGDRVTMVVYAGSSGLVLPPTNGEKKADILAAIEKLKAGGSTHGSAGIQLAYEQAVAGFIKEGVNRVILCTDGDFNVGVSSPEELEKLITQKAKSGVFLSVLGFGSGNLKDRTMETLADKGNGNYAYIDSFSEARKVLVEQMSGTLVTIAKDVKIQVEFNPAAVRSYRLIGYENRMLAKEDFNDDTKDAGEIGAGHSVVALYEVVPANLPPGAEPRPAVDGLKYQTPAIAPAQLADAAKSGETMTVKLRYKEPEGETSQLIEVPTKDEGKTLTASSEEFKFSAAVAGFGLLLRDSAYKGTLSWESVRRLALDGKGTDKLGYRGEFLQLIDKARGLKEMRP